MTASSPEQVGPRRFYQRTFGCQMNDHDAERIRAMIEAAGLERTVEPDDADLLVYTTCTVRASADERLAGHLSLAGRLKRERPERRVVVAGCVPQAEGEAFLQRYPFVDLILGPMSLHDLPALLDDLLEERASTHGTSSSANITPVWPRAALADSALFSGDLPSRRERPYQAWVQAMSGCTNFCSYCIVPFVRGPERSRPEDSIVAEVRDLVADGVLEVTLLGQNVNAYGLDLPSAPGFAGLLRTLGEVDGLARLRFMTSHPRDLSDQLVAAIAEVPVVCEHVHLPAQSGSDRILAAMNRGYGAEWYVNRVAALRAAIPGVALTTDLIVGFPGETEADFEATMALARAAAFDAAFTFVYSPRERTAAASMAAQVSEDVKRDRITRLIDLVQLQARAANQARVGRSEEVLVEGPSRRNDLWRGRSRRNTTVNFSGDVRPGTLVPVTITGASSTTLSGRA
jgi:tRNA-2-methylthio-N6-dimethylallyladenosine synthase